MNQTLTLSSDKLSAVSQRITFALFGAQSITSAAVTNAFTVTPIVAAFLGGTDEVAGYPTMFQSIGRAAAAYPIGWLMDRAGRRLGLSLGYLFGVIGAMISMGAVIQGSFPLFLAGATIFGMMRAGAEQARFVAAEVNPTERRARVIGLLVFAGTIGSVIGPRLVPWSDRLAQGRGLPENAGPFAVAALAAAIGIVVVMLFLRPDPLQVGRLIAADEAVKMPAAAAPSSQKSLRQIYSNRVVWLAVASMVIGQVVMTFLMVITPVHMRNHNHDLDAISWVITAHTLGMFGLSVVTGWLIDAIGQFPVIGLGALILILSAIILPISPAFMPIALALFLLGLGWNFCYVAGSSLLSNALSADDRGRAQGANDFMVAVGAGLGSLFSGIIFHRAGIVTLSGVGLVMGAVLLIQTGWVAFTRRK